jgi:hypothetical protein
MAFIVELEKGVFLADGKAASAQIAKIPRPLAEWIAQYWRKS